MYITYGIYCKNQFCQCNRNGRCTSFDCVYTGGFYTSDRTEMTINNQDNKTTKIESDYIICPHCGEKIYK